jgi:hypothetical protein
MLSFNVRPLSYAQPLNNPRLGQAQSLNNVRPVGFGEIDINKIQTDELRVPVAGHIKKGIPDGYELFYQYPQLNIRDSSPPLTPTGPCLLATGGTKDYLQTLLDNENENDYVEAFKKAFLMATSKVRFINLTGTDPDKLKPL